jgi:HSPB1-associated protein 1
LHSQIHGYKRWLLFPPETDLRPTRLPYEESSVFSSIDIIGATMLIEEAKNLPSPYVVVCGPGDLLFVPHKW